MDQLRYAIQLFFWTVGLCLIGINIFTSVVPRLTADTTQIPLKQFANPVAVVADGDAVDFVDHDQMRVIRLSPDGELSLVAGNGDLVARGDGGLAIQAGMYVIGLARDQEGNLYLADHGNHRIRRVDTQGIITTVAGTGRPGYGGDGGIATQAELNSPVALVFDRSGTFYISDYVNHRIRRVDSQGRITTLAGNGQPGFSPDGTPATQAQINSPWGITLDCQGRVIFSDLGSQSVKRIEGGKLVTLLKNLNRPTGLAMECGPVETLYVSDVGTNQILTLSQGVQRVIAGVAPKGLGDGGPALQAGLNAPYALTLDSRGQLIIADANQDRLRLIDRKGFITSLLTAKPR